MVRDLHALEQLRSILGEHVPSREDWLVHDGDVWILRGFSTQPATARGPSHSWMAYDLARASWRSDGEWDFSIVAPRSFGSGSATYRLDESSIVIALAAVLLLERNPQFKASPLWPQSDSEVVDRSMVLNPLTLGLPELLDFYRAFTGADFLAVLEPGAVEPDEHLYLSHARPLEVRYRERGHDNVVFSAGSAQELAVWLLRRMLRVPAKGEVRST